MHRVPFKPGEKFDPLKTGPMIRNLYTELKRFRNIIVKGKNVDNEQIDNNRSVAVDDYNHDNNDEVDVGAGYDNFIR